MKSESFIMKPQQKQEALSFEENSFHGYKLFTPDQEVIIKTDFCPLQITKDYVIARVKPHEIIQMVNLPLPFREMIVEKKLFFKKSEIDEIVNDNVNAKK